MLYTLYEKLTNTPEYVSKAIKTLLSSKVNESGLKVYELDKANLLKNNGNVQYSDLLDLLELVDYTNFKEKALQADAAAYKQLQEILLDKISQGIKSLKDERLDISIQEIDAVNDIDKAKEFLTNNKEKIQNAEYSVSLKLYANLYYELDKENPNIKEVFESFEKDMFSSFLNDYSREGFHILNVNENRVQHTQYRSPDPSDTNSKITNFGEFKDCYKEDNALKSIGFENIIMMMWQNFGSGITKETKLKIKDLGEVEVQYMRSSRDVSYKFVLIEGGHKKYCLTAPLVRKFLNDKGEEVKTLIGSVELEVTPRTDTNEPDIKLRIISKEDIDLKGFSTVQEVDYCNTLASYVSIIDPATAVLFDGNVKSKDSPRFESILVKRDYENNIEKTKKISQTQEIAKKRSIDQEIIHSIKGMYYTIKRQEELGLSSQNLTESLKTQAGDIAKKKSEVLKKMAFFTACSGFKVSDKPNQKYEGEVMTSASLNNLSVADVMGNGGHGGRNFIVIKDVGNDSNAFLNWIAGNDATKNFVADEVFNSAKAEKDGKIFYSRSTSTHSIENKDGQYVDQRGYGVGQWLYTNFADLYNKVIDKQQPGIDKKEQKIDIPHKGMDIAGVNPEELITQSAMNNLVRLQAAGEKRSLRSSDGHLYVQTKDINNNNVVMLGFEGSPPHGESQYGSHSYLGGADKLSFIGGKTNINSSSAWESKEFKEELANDGVILPDKDGGHRVEMSYAGFKMLQKYYEELYTVTLQENVEYDGVKYQITENEAFAIILSMPPQDDHKSFLSAFKEARYRLLKEKRDVNQFINNEVKLRFPNKYKAVNDTKALNNHIEDDLGSSVIEDAAKLLAKQNEVANEKIRELEEEIKYNETNIVSLKEQIESFKTAIKSIKQENQNLERHYQNELKTLGDRVLILQTENEQITQQKTALEAEKTCISKDHQEKIAEVNQEIEALKAQLDTANSDKAALEQLNQDLAAIRSEINAANVDKSKLERERDDLSNELAIKIQELEALKQKLTDADNANKTLADKKAEVEDAKKQLTDEVTQLKKELEGLKTQLDRDKTSLTTEKNNIEQDRNKQRDRADNLQRDKDALDQPVRDLQDRVNQLTDQQPNLINRAAARKAILTAGIAAGYDVSFVNIAKFAAIWTRRVLSFVAVKALAQHYAPFASESLVDLMQNKKVQGALSAILSVVTEAVSPRFKSNNALLETLNAFMGAANNKEAEKAQLKLEANLTDVEVTAVQEKYKPSMLENATGLNCFRKIAVKSEAKTAARAA
ncbi:MAG: hypothetical protein J0G32_02365 [Alphaproteobacteria bacterium]|nr:hypothetical protein [Alphaproteobacteria bacterium]OJV12201.1 MAG: hypothetical protein BGO27_05630 [Alphaproteobacteria bacterium 33-17]